MVGTHRMAETARAETGDALVAGRRRATGGTSGAVAGAQSLLAIQRSAGNAAVTALLAAKSKAPGEQALADIDTALKEVRKDEPALDPVEKGLQAARTAGVPVDLEGPRPPASALAVVRTGFGPGMVAPPKAVPPPKPVPLVNPLGKAAAKPGSPGKGAAKGPPKAALPAKGSIPAQVAGSAAVVPTGPAPLSADKLFQPPVAPTSLRPEQDPGFAQVAGRIGAVAASRRAHPPAAAKAKEAQEAAVAPSDDLGAQAKAAKVDTMDAQPVGAFDKKAFIAAVKDAVEAKSPKTLEEADEYKESGKAGEVKGDVKSLVGQGKEGQAKDVEAATDAPPDPSKAVPKPVRPLSPEQPGTAGAVPAAGAVPKPAPPEQTNLAAGKHAAEQEMADAGVTEEQLAQSNEPEFQQAVTDKRSAAAHAETAPAEFRRQEQQIVQQNRAEAAAETTAGVTGMQGAKAGALAQLVGDKGKTKSKDEARRAEVTAKIQGIFAATEADVKKILDGIDPKVEAAFETGEARARQVFENYVDVKMRAYKKDRYGGWLGPLRWAKDKMLGMPSKVDEFYAAGRKLYLKEMDGVISRVADVVGGDLTAAKQRIARGKAEITAYAKSLPADLQKVGAEATQEIGDRFAQLESDVDAKQQAVVDTLATKYVESRKGIDERIEAMQAQNKGLVDKAVGAIKAVVGTIRELAAMLKNVLSRAAGVVGDIIKNPIGFLGHLIAGVKGGILKFKDNILGHLRKGLMGWLFGALAEGGIELPDTFDLKGVVKLLASLFGLTWARIRARIAKRIGEPAMAAVEKGVEIFQLIATQGVAGLWQLLVEKIGNLKDMILEKVQDFVVTKVITAGITWLISLLNPAAAFIKACKLIYDVVMFFVNNAARLAKFVDTIIDSVADIVRGNVGSVVTKIENVLGQMVPLLIGFLASVLGLGGIGQKIREIVTALQKPVKQALDFVIKSGLKLAGPIIRGLTKLGGKVKAKVAAGKAWVKKKAGKGLSALRELKDRMLGITFRANFDVQGEKHSVYTKKGTLRALYTASDEKPSEMAAPTPTVKSLGAEYRAVIDRYAATVHRINTSARNSTLSTEAEKLKNEAHRIFMQLVRATKTYVTSRGRSKGDPIGGSAEGLGTIGLHGKKPSSLRGGHRLHWLESEHVIPFAVGKSVWRALSEYIPDRGTREDNRQTTIMIYERAARLKTPADNAISYTIKSLLMSSGFIKAIFRGRISGAVGLSDTDADDALARVFGVIESVRTDAVDRTVKAVVEENKMKEPGSQRTNGQRRGNEKPTPDRTAIRNASRQQFDDIMKLVREEVEHQVEVRKKVERIRARPPKGTQ